MNNNCSNCGEIPDTVEKTEDIAKYRKKLHSVKGAGHYYRGESLQLSNYKLLQCPSCSTYFEDGHHFYSDPESTMVLGRDEDEWFRLIRLSPDLEKKRLAELKSK
jgi:hypothetical protein